MLYICMHITHTLAGPSHGPSCLSVHHHVSALGEGAGKRGVETNWDLIVLGLTGTDTNIIRTRFTVVYSVSFKYKTFVGFILLLSTYVRYFGKNNISMAIV